MVVRSRFRNPRHRVWTWTVLLGALAAAVKLGLLTGADDRVAGWVWAKATSERDAVAAAVTFFGSASWTLGFMALMSGWYWRRGQRHAVAVLWATFTLALLLQALLRLTIGQVRPDAVFIAAPSDLRARLEITGFTSGHAFRSAFLFGWLVPGLLRRGRAWGVLGAVGLVVLIGLVGATRLYLHRHWMTDVVGGWLVAMVALSVASWWRAAREHTPAA